MALRESAITFKVTDEEEAAFKAEAARRHTDLSEWIRQILHAALDATKEGPWWAPKAPTGGK